MSDTQTYTLSETVLNQKTGIVAVWSKYASGAVDSDWHYFFIPKHHAIIHPGNGIGMTLRNTSTSVATKYLYINDDIIKGAATNANSPNTNFVLRYILGV